MGYEQFYELIADEADEVPKELTREDRNSCGVRINEEEVRVFAVGLAKGILLESRVKALINFKYQKKYQ